MFSKHDPRADALRAVHEGRAAVAGTKANPEWLIDDEPAWGLLEDLHAGGYIFFDADASLPQSAKLTQLGQAAAIVVLGIFPARPTVAPAVSEVPGEGAIEADVDQHDDHDDDAEVPAAVSAGGAGVVIEYFGLAPESYDFANSDAFRAIITKHGLQLKPADEDVLPDGQLLTEPVRLWVVDPVSGASLAVLYDDESGTSLEAPGFLEILQLMDEHVKTNFQGRLFRDLVDEDDLDDDELEVLDELDDMVSEGHPYYELEFDFTTGAYKRD